MDHQTVPPLAPEQDGALIAELSVRLRRRPDASSLQFILNVAQLLGQSAHNAPLLLPLLPMILHGMARHLESDGVQACRYDLELDNCTRTAHALCLHSSCTRLALRVRITRTARALYTQECGVGLFANLAVPRGSRSSLVANGCLQHAFLSLRQYPDNPMLHRNSFRLLRNVFVAAGHAALDRWGYGAASVRFICGTQGVHLELEQALTTFLRTEDTILFGSCFDANGGVFETLLTAEDAVISDSLNHASIIDGVRLCKAQRFRYANRDLADLEDEYRVGAL